MIYYQVLDLHQGFQHLNQLKDNEWREPEIKPKQVKPIISKKSTKVMPKVDKSKPIVRSKIREQIMNLKNKRSEQTEVKDESFGEKENKKIENSVESDKKWDSMTKKIEPIVKSVDKCSETVPVVRNVLKRTPLLKK